MRLADKIATMARRGAPLPYDAEVEWFKQNFYSAEGGYSGSNSFDLGIVYDNDTGFEIELTRFSDNTSDQVAFGSRDNNGGDNRYFVGGTINRLWYFGYGTRIDFGNCVVGEKTILSLNLFNSKEVKFNGISGGFFQSHFNGNVYPVCYPGYHIASVFGKTKLYGVSGAFFGYDRQPYYSYGYLKLTKGNKLVRDIIPVRVGQKLRLFDKIDNLLFEPLLDDDIATFTLGPDKV